MKKRKFILSALVAAVMSANMFTGVLAVDTITDVAQDVEIEEESKDYSKVNIPADKKSIGKHEFMTAGGGWAEKILLITVDPDNEYFTTVDGVLYDKDLTVLYLAPKNLEGDYVIPDSVKEIWPFALSHCKSLTSVTLPDGLEKIDEGAFGDCVSLATINFPSSLKTIGKSAFSATALTSVDLSGTQVIDIDWASFANNYSLTTVKLNPNTETIGMGAFGMCTVLQEIVIPYSVAEIGGYAFFQVPEEAIIYERDRPTEPVQLSYSSESISDSVQKVTVTSSRPIEALELVFSSDMVVCDENGVPATQAQFAENLIEKQFFGSSFVKGLENTVSISAVNQSASLVQKDPTDLFSFYVQGDKSPTLTMVPYDSVGDEFEQSFVQDATKTVYYPTSISEEKRQILGDIDSSGAIEVDDALMIFKHIATIETIPDDAIVRADINANGEIDVADAIEIFKHMAGVDSDYSNAIGSII